MRLTTHLSRAATLFFFAALLGALVFRVVQFFAEVWRAINFPYGLDWAEGAVWVEATLIPGPRMYAPVDDPPFLIFPYPLIYHLAVRGLMALGADPLVAGRSLAFACTLVIAGLCGVLVNRAMRGAVSGPARWLGVAIAILVPLTYHPVTYWAQQMRVDTLAIALSFLGVTLAVFAVRRPVLLCPAVIAFVLAVYTKQVELTASAAAVVVTFILNRRQTILAALGGLAIAVAALLALEWMTNGGFLRHLLFDNLNPFSLRVAGAYVAQIYWDHLVYFVFSVVGFVVMWAREIRSSPVRTLAVFLIESDLRIVLAVSTLWFALSSVMLVTSGKFGANENYFIEAMCVWSIPLGMLAAFVADRALAPTSGPWAGGLAAVLALALLFQVKQVGPKQYGNLHDPAFAAANARLIKDAQAADRPVYSEDLVISMRSGKGVVAAPPLLQAHDEPAFVSMIEAKDFAFLILQYDERGYPADLLAAMRASYPVSERVGPYLVRRPQR
jgi:hypothetical protein